MGDLSVVYVPKAVLPVDSETALRVLEYDGVSFNLFHERGIPLYCKCIDRDVVADAITGVVQDLPGDLDDFVEYFVGAEGDIVVDLMRDVLLLVRDLKFLAGLLEALDSVSGIVLPESVDPGSVVPAGRGYPPDEYVSLRSWVDERLGV